MRRSIFFVLAVAIFCVSTGQTTFAQKAQINGRITDSTGAVVGGAKVTLTDVDTGINKTATSNEEGYYTVGLLDVGRYQLLVEMGGFKPISRSGIKLNINEVVRMDFTLEVGELAQRVEVIEDASPLNFDNAELKQAITPETLRELPLIVGGLPRSAISFVVLMPGVTTGAGANTYDTRINGGIGSGDEAVLDGISIQDGLNTQTGAALVFGNSPFSPEAISEISVLTSNAEPQYGSTSSGVVTGVTKSGTNEFHGALFEFHRNTVLNARQFGVPERPKDLENDFGGNVGGPVKIPGLWSSRKKTYFFFGYERFRIRGGASTPVLSIPSLKQRQGDFSDWVDSDGRVIPVFDPATTHPNPAFDPNLQTGPNNLPFLRDQFMGCDGNTPNVICASDPRLQNSLAKQWFQFLPTPTFSGPLNNYVVPVPVGEGIFNDSNLLDLRVDHIIGDNDHVYATMHSRSSFAPEATRLPPQLAQEQPYQTNQTVMPRLAWDHTFSPRLLNHLAGGYNDTFAESFCIDKQYAGQLPQIPGVADHANPPVLYFDDFASYGCNNEFKGTRPTYIVNDLLTWIRGAHSFKFGGEYRKLGINRLDRFNGSGSFGFSRLNTGLIGLTSGNSIASFILDSVDNASAEFRTLEDWYARADAWSLHFGDTWKITPKLSLSYGVRWDVSRPSVEKYDRTSFLDPFGPNPAAGNRPGRLAFAGTKWGAASFGERHPEQTWYRGFAPRLSLAYSLTPKTVLRSGYGIVYTQAYYPGWNGGVASDGFNATVGYSSSLGGLDPAFILSEGLPQNFVRPPFIDPSYRNGQGLRYRPFDANRLPYSQQWNLTIEHQFTSNFYVSTAYVANKLTRLPSRVVPLNALDPKLLSMGQKLNDEFQPGQTSLDGVPIPYPGWVEQMTGCAPTVAQALLPYPQYCSGLFGQNENAGNSSFHSFQLKAEKRFSSGIWMLGSYTVSKLLTSTDSVQADAQLWSGAHGAISPYERRRNKALALNDVPQVLSVAMIYQLPFGKGQRFLNTGGAVDKMVRGWQLSSIFRGTSGVPLVFRSGACNVPGQFRAGCIPALLPAANPFSQEKSSFDPANPLLNKNAFEPADSFNFYYGQGPRVSNIRGFGYYNHDLSIIKNTQIREGVNVQFRAEFFNLWNWHNFTSKGGEDGLAGGFSAFDTDVSSPGFGIWNGSVSAPRNIQLGLKILF